jgi:putative transposase
MLPIWKESKPELSEVYSQVLQEAVQRVDLAFKAFFRRVKAGDEPGYPRFKGRNWYDSLTYPQSGFTFEDNILHLSKIGDLKVWLHREVEGTIKRLTIRRSATRKWYVSFLVEDAPKDAVPDSEKAVGIDVGISNFAVLSNGIFIENQRYWPNVRRSLPKHNARKISFPISHQNVGKLQRKSVTSTKDLVISEITLLTNSAIR